MKQRTLSFICGALFFFACVPVVLAQSTIEPVAAPAKDNAPMQANTSTTTQSGIMPLASASANPYLDTYLALQQQIALLNRLLERERSVTEMVQNYKRIGLVYAPPKPELSLCQKLPQNLSCALAYPEHYADFLPPPAPVPDPVIAVPLSDVPQSIADLSPDFDVQELLWTDITCMGDTCRAVITPNIQSRGARYAIRVGDRLPQGGTVESISSQGVFISRGNKIITLSPAPANPYTASARANTSL